MGAFRIGRTIFKVKFRIRLARTKTQNSLDY